MLICRIFGDIVRVGISFGSATMILLGMKGLHHAYRELSTSPVHDVYTPRAAHVHITRYHSSFLKGRSARTHTLHIRFAFFYPEPSRDAPRVLDPVGPVAHFFKADSVFASEGDMNRYRCCFDTFCGSEDRKGVVENASVLGCRHIALRVWVF